MSVCLTAAMKGVGGGGAQGRRSERERERERERGLEALYFYKFLHSDIKSQIH